MSVKLWDSTITVPAIGNGIFIDSNGYIHVCGLESNEASGVDLYYAISTDGGTTFTDGEGGGTGTKKSLITNLASPRAFPAIAVDDNDNIFVFYSTASSGTLSFFKKSSGIWSGSTSTGLNRYYNIIRVEIDSDNNIIIFGGGNTYTHRIATSTDAGVTWVEETSSHSGVNNYRLGDLCLTTNQNLYAVWYRDAIPRRVIIAKITKTEGTPDTWTITDDSSMPTDNSRGTPCTIISKRDTEDIYMFQAFYSGEQYRLQYQLKSSGSWLQNFVDILTNANYAYKNLQVIRKDNDKFYLIYEKENNTSLFFVYFNGVFWSDEAVFKTNATLCCIQQPNLLSSDNKIYFTYQPSSTDERHFDIYTLESPVTETDTITLSDDIFITQSNENFTGNETLTISDDLLIAQNFDEEHEDLNINDSFELTLQKTKEESLNLSDSLYIQLNEYEDLENDFRMSLSTIEDIGNKINTAYSIVSEALNMFNMVKGNIQHLINDFRTLKLSKSSVHNDIRTRLSWQKPAELGFQSLGKEYIKLYIGGIEQTDVDIDTININKSLSSAHTATFTLARPYDSSAPTLEQSVEIKYDSWLIYKGYVTQVLPTGDSDTIKIQCQDQYWYQNKHSLSFFFVGHKPQDNKDLYYSTIAQGLSALGAFGIGSFVPETIDCFGKRESDSITTLLNQCGNYEWYYDENFNKQLWTSGSGDVVTLMAQVLGQNINLYNVISHDIKENAENIVNQYRVQMGKKIVRRFNSSGGNKQYTSYYYSYSPHLNAFPAWDASYEILAKNSNSGYGWDNPNKNTPWNYQDIFKKYDLPYIDDETESWSDVYPPEVLVALPGGDWKYSFPVTQTGTFELGVTGAIFDEGFTVDYARKTLTFSNPVYLYQENQYGELIAVRAPNIQLRLWKKLYLSNTTSPSQDPATETGNDLMFFTSKMGDYPSTILENLNMSNYGIQVGGRAVDSSGNRIYVPSWDDTQFAHDVANWKLSQNCDKDISGTLTITLDAFLYYAIQLNKRIYVENVTEIPLNITDILINISDFTVTLNLKNGRGYTRTVSIPTRGE